MKYLLLSLKLPIPFTIYNLIKIHLTMASFYYSNYLARLVFLLHSNHYLLGYIIQAKAKNILLETLFLHISWPWNLEISFALILILHLIFTFFTFRLHFYVMNFVLEDIPFLHDSIWLPPCWPHFFIPLRMRLLRPTFSIKSLMDLNSWSTTVVFNFKFMKLR